MWFTVYFLSRKVCPNTNLHRKTFMRKAGIVREPVIPCKWMKSHLDRQEAGIWAI